MKYKIFEKIAETIGWIMIAAPSSTIGIAIGIAIYYANSNLLTLICGTSLSVVGIALGLFWSNKVSKNTGTVKFISSIYRTPELEKKE